MGVAAAQILGCQSARQGGGVKAVSDEQRGATRGSNAAHDSAGAPADDFVESEPSRMAVEDQQRGADALNRPEKAPHRTSPLRPPPRR